MICRNTDQERDLIRLVRAAEIGKPNLGQRAVGQDNDVVGAGKQENRTPVVLDDTPVGAVSKCNPVADGKGRPNVSAMPENTSPRVL